MGIDDILTEIESAFYDIPFGNSDYQNRAFVMAAEMTPARAYRHIGLRMFDRISAIKELKYSRLLQDVDIEEKEAQIADPQTNKFDKRRRIIELDQIRDRITRVDKLLNDSIQELNCLYSEFKKFPRYSRLEFEAEEEKHFELKIQHGADNSKLAMGLLKDFDNVLIATNEQLLLNKHK